MMEMVKEKENVQIKWIREEEFMENKEIVKQKNVRKKVGIGSIRMVEIGENGYVDQKN